MAIPGPSDILGRVDRFQQARTPTAVVVGVVKKFGEDQGGYLAALVSYYLFFSIFPLLMVFVAVLGYVIAAHPDVQQKLLDSALASFPVVGDQIRSNIGSPTGRGATLVVGLLVALWGGTAAIAAMQNAMNAIWDVPRVDRPGFVRQRLRSLLMLLVLAAAVTASTLLGSLAGAAASWPLVGRIAVEVPTLAINVALFWVSFKVLTEESPSWRTLLPGAVAAGVGFTFLETVGAAYVNHVVQGASRTYGTFAVVLGLLSWLYLQAQITLFCAEINVVREKHLYPRSLVASALTEGDEAALRSLARTEERHEDETIEVHIDENGEGRPDPA